jgi:mRNA-degrading endonuclease RelE of RelBE toxin-antitoxin system
MRSPSSSASQRRATSLGRRLRGLRSLRVGTYRTVYQLEDDQRVVRVLALRHRSVAYTTNPS